MRAVNVRNRLLQLIPAAERNRLISCSELVSMKPRQVLHHWRLPLESVYFVEDGLVAVSAKVEENRYVAAWLVGSEGVIGAPLVLIEDDRQLFHRRVVQVSGSAYRLSASTLTAILPELPVLRDVILRYVTVVLMQTSQAGACNTVHRVHQRLSRWLLVASNALQSPDVPLTHEVLGQLLGVRRASVTQCLEVLERDGCITNTRGAIRIESVAALREASCGCFSLIDREYLRVLGASPTSMASNRQT
jgi:CRP-like cAMP-binding protein